ncbi:MAG: hypothetical protein FWB93_04935 [Oscillospiraceae bacterium]|nr:hypothetical protein [Oscillospiraceae bacterium]
MKLRIKYEYGRARRTVGANCVRLFVLNKRHIVVGAGFGFCARPMLGACRSSGRPGAVVPTGCCAGFVVL